VGNSALILLEIDCRWPESLLQAGLAKLPEDIQERAARYLAPDSRRNLIATRTRLRETLERLGLSQSEIRVADNGRPYHASQEIQFNISHSHDRAFLCLSRDRDLLEGLGVDVEWSRRKVDVEGIGHRFFTPREYEWIGGDADRFFHVWTRKEAIIKSNGVGLRVALDSFEVLTDQVGAHVTGRPLLLGTQPCLDNYLVSWAVAKVPSRIHFLSDLSPDWLDRLGDHLTLSTA
jgi:4'-phosphopantetheinyl transferase